MHGPFADRYDARLSKFTATSRSLTQDNVEMELPFDYNETDMTGYMPRTARRRSN